MNQNFSIKIFISYSHSDEPQLKEFIRFLAPLLENNGSIELWYDRKILPGANFQAEIDLKFEASNIFCLLISANFLNSKACMEEKKKALDLRFRKGAVIIPIILSCCGWMDDPDIPLSLALPTDGKPITAFEKLDQGWYDVYCGLKAKIEYEKKISNLTIKKPHQSFLSSPDLLEKAHSKKEIVLIDDIFVYPELVKFDDLGEYEKNESAEDLTKFILEYKKILISGENQSGKTTICKILFLQLRALNLVPVYICEAKNYYKGKIQNLISKSFQDQYEKGNLSDYDKFRIVPIVDDFHFANNKEKHIQELSYYEHQLIIVDDIFSLNFKEGNLINSYIHFRIKEFKPSLRNKLIKKWTDLSDCQNTDSRSNSSYKTIDDISELVDGALGKLIGTGIMPSYPFFILSIISTYETFQKPLNQEISSQGYCYQALIYLYLRKQGVKNEDIDTYINFLTEFSFFMYTNNKIEISLDEFDQFIKTYSHKYNLSVPKQVVINKLNASQIIKLDSFNNFSFYYKYIYYFFVAKFLAEHVESNKVLITKITNNLHKDENAYIAIFMSHHSMNNFILDEITLNALELFDKYEPASLSEDELNFFDECSEYIANAVLPSTTSTPEEERTRILNCEDLKEEKNLNNICHGTHKKEPYKLDIELRRSIKTVEVMGCIIKNRSGSLEKRILEFIFKEAMKVHLRILSSFFEFIKDKNQQNDILEYISCKLNIINEKKLKKDREENKKPRPLPHDKLQRLAQIIFWNLNFIIVFGIINKIIHSLGSTKLISIAEKVCDEENTPSSFLIKNGILMWHNKNLQVDNIAKTIESDGYSKTAKKIIKFHSCPKTVFDEYIN